MLYSSHILLLTLLFGQNSLSTPLTVSTRRPINPYPVQPSHNPQERDTCPSGTTLMAGDDYDVCCPGKAVVDGTDPYCCIGKKQDDEKDKRGICVGAAGCDDDDDDAYGTKSCSVAVPATAKDFSDRVAQATATTTDEPDEDPTDEPDEDPTDEPDADPTDEPDEDPTDEPDEDAANLLAGNLWILTASSALAFLAALA